MKIQTEITLKVEVELDYIPRRPAPACRNPSDPCFSDPGDDPELQVKAIKLLTDGGEIAIPENIRDEIESMFYDDFIDQAEREWDESMSWDMAEQEYYNSMEV
jgi:hypothetical protein